MIVKWLIVLFFFMELCNAAKGTEATTLTWDFNQNGYDDKLERMIVVSYNHSYFRYIHGAAVPYNRTQRVYNGTLELLIDIISPGATKLDIQMYKFISNEYRFFPVTVTVNPCLEYAQNSFHAKDLATRTSNFRGCPVRNGFYSITNALPDASKFAPLMPTGHYKTNTNIYYKSDFLVELEFYCSVMDKPMKWQK